MTRIEPNTTAPGCVPAPDGSCSLCGDEAELGRVVAIESGDGTATVRLDGGLATVALDLLDTVAVGDAVLVHMGFAIAKVGAA